MKKVLKSLLVLAIVFSMTLSFGITTKADTTSGDYSYSVDGGTATITQYNGSGGAVTIPDTIDGHKVTGVGDNLFNANKTITSVVLPNGLKSIGACAFSGCTGLDTDIVIPDSVTKIDQCAFSGCNIKSITIPGGVTTIDSYAFSGCYLESVKVSEGVKIIDMNAFELCSQLQNVTLPDSLLYIAEAAFYECSSLENITIPKKIKHIKTETFRNCTNLTSITIPDGVTSIGETAFWKCGLKTIKLPKNLTYIGAYAFQYSGLTSLTIPKNVKVIDGFAFGECANLNSVTFSEGLVQIGDGAFYECDKLKSVSLPGSIKYFCGSIAFPDKTVISAPKGSKAAAFAKDRDKNVTDPGCIPVIPMPNFSTPPATPVAPVPTDYSYTVDGGGATITGYNGFDEYISIPDTLGGHKVTTIGTYAFRDNKFLVNAVIPNGVTKIDIGAFDSCSELRSVVLPDSLTFIGTDAFKISGLDSITIPNSVTYIGDGAVAYCDNLASFTAKSGTTILGTDMFSGCRSGLVLYGQKGSTLQDYATNYSDSDVKFALISSANANTKPATPGSFAVKKASATNAQCTWAAVGGATGYEVYYSTSAQGPFNLAGSTTNALSYTKLSLTAGKNYYFKVRAYKTVNGAKVYGGYTKVLNTKM